MVAGVVTTTSITRHRNSERACAGNIVRDADTFSGSGRVTQVELEIQLRLHKCRRCR